MAVPHPKYRASGLWGLVFYRVWSADQVHSTVIAQPLSTSACKNKRKHALWFIDPVVRLDIRLIGNLGGRIDRGSKIREQASRNNRFVVDPDLKGLILVDDQGIQVGVGIVSNRRRVTEMFLLKLTRFRVPVTEDKMDLYIRTSVL